MGKNSAINNVFKGVCQINSKAKFNIFFLKNFFALLLWSHTSVALILAFEAKQFSYSP